MDVLKNKRYPEVTVTSRYNGCPAYYHSLDNKYVLGRDRWLKNTTLFITHVVQPNESYDYLALKYYNNPTLFWIICSFNRVQDPYINPEAGSIIKIPTMSNIEFEE